MAINKLKPTTTVCDLGKGRSAEKQLMNLSKKYITYHTSTPTTQPLEKAGNFDCNKGNIRTSIGNVFYYISVIANDRFNSIRIWKDNVILITQLKLTNCTDRPIYHRYLGVCKKWFAFKMLNKFIEKKGINCFRGVVERTADSKLWFISDCLVSEIE